MLDNAQIAAVAAVIRTGGFDKAAQQLSLTPSAISQRVKLIEERLGAVLIVRGQPCVATEAGQRLFRHAEEVGLLEQALRSDLGIADARGPWPSLRIAVNADSLATWFVAAIAATEGCLFDLVLDDQDHSADWLRRGEVRAAVSGDGDAVQGCDCRPLGALRYIATASPDYMRRWFAGGVTRDGLSVAPSLTFNNKDRLQERWIERHFGGGVAPPTHWLPSAHGFVDATLAGIGWGMNPQTLVQPWIDAGRLVPLVADSPFDVPLFWHWSRSVQTAMKTVTPAVCAAAAAVLRPLPPP
ncbi:LysR family transcriptional regulator ArgP [Agrobacterium sp. a22-2]|uniref:LysR family transcriptional regulator ArgP n=1 Tax=Agrobacterium sp. a22-2 TaxID=2283840 RepID=UPI00144833AF|nr:LysR family transcriptional regulator ArgP [Agrobacterium sp. a22-2]NKN38452.1 LysR family transcriptional regulator ArgP [Agrobacterium sp. a22-2]